MIGVRQNRAHDGLGGAGQNQQFAAVDAVGQAAGQGSEQRERQDLGHHQRRDAMTVVAPCLEGERKDSGGEEVSAVRDRPCTRGDVDVAPPGCVVDRRCEGHISKIILHISVVKFQSAGKARNRAATLRASGGRFGARAAPVRTQEVLDGGLQLLELLCGDHQLVPGQADRLVPVLRYVVCAAKPTAHLLLVATQHDLEQGDRRRQSLGGFGVVGVERESAHRRAPHPLPPVASAGRLFDQADLRERAQVIAGCARREPDTPGRTRWRWRFDIGEVLKDGDPRRVRHRPHHLGITNGDVGALRSIHGHGLTYGRQKLVVGHWRSRA